MRKILFILPSLAVGGLERVQVSIANVLARKGYDVTIMILNPIKDLASELDEKVRLIYRPEKPHKIMRRIPYIRHKFYDDGMWERRVSAKKLYKYYVGDEKFDVEIGFFRGLPVKIISGSTNKNSIKLAWVHNDFKVCQGVANNFKNMQHVRSAYAKFDQIICVSKQAERSFMDMIGCEGKSTTIYNLLPIEEIIVKSAEIVDLEKKRTTICSVGRLSKQKGYDRLLSVVARLNADGLDFDLWLIGDGVEKENLQNIAKEKSLTNVLFLGKQRNPYKYMKQADLYVCSSLYEGFNLTVAEAMILGVPVLSTKCTGPCEILDDGKYGVIVENSEEGLYQGLKEFLTDRDKLLKYKEKAKERKDFFDEERICKEIEGLLGEANESYSYCSSI